MHWRSALGEGAERFRGVQELRRGELRGASRLKYLALVDADQLGDQPDDSQEASR